MNTISTRFCIELNRGRDYIRVPDHMVPGGSATSIWIRNGVAWHYKNMLDPCVASLKSFCLYSLGS